MKVNGASNFPFPNALQWTQVSLMIPSPNRYSCLVTVPQETAAHYGTAASGKEPIAM